LQKNNLSNEDFVTLTEEMNEDVPELVDIYPEVKKKKKSKKRKNNNLEEDHINKKN